MFLTLNQQNQKVQQIQAQEPSTNQVSISETLITQGGGIIAFLFFWGSFLFLASRKIKGRLDDQFECPTNSVSNYRCTQCRYYSKNHFLNCAVQPNIVLTDEANNCSDYSPKKIK